MKFVTNNSDTIEGLEAANRVMEICEQQEKTLTIVDQAMEFVREQEPAVAKRIEALKARISSINTIQIEDGGSPHQSQRAIFECQGFTNPSFEEPIVFAASEFCQPKTIRWRLQADAHGVLKFGHIVYQLTHPDDVAKLETAIDRLARRSLTDRVTGALTDDLDYLLSGMLVRPSHIGLLSAIKRDSFDPTTGSELPSAPFTCAANSRRDFYSLRTPSPISRRFSVSGHARYLLLRGGQSLDRRNRRRHLRFGDHAARRRKAAVFLSAASAHHRS